MKKYNIIKRIKFLALTFALSLAVFTPSIAQAACSSPAGAEGDQIYNTTHKTMQFCDNTNWISMKGGAVLIDKLASMGCANNQVVKFSTGSGDWLCANDNAGDNLGNHTATTTLNMSAQAITSSAGTIRDANGGWVRTYGDTGWYNATHGGGWFMNSSAYLRNYNNTPLLLLTSGTTTVSAINSSGMGLLGQGTSFGVSGESSANYGVYGKTTNATYGGVLGYAANGTTYGILGHANAWSFYGNSNTYTSGYVRGDQGFQVGGTTVISSSGIVIGGVPVCDAADEALQFNGTVWSCATIAGGGGGGGGAGSCGLPWGGSIADGASVTAYLAPQPTTPCLSQTRNCTTGTLSGGYLNQSCTPHCPTQSVSWSGCAATATNTASGGSSGTVSDSYCCTGTACACGGGTNSCSGKTGSATFSCSGNTWSYTGGSCSTCYTGGCSGCGDNDEATADLNFIIENKGQLIDLSRKNKVNGQLCVKSSNNNQDCGSN